MSALSILGTALFSHDAGPLKALKGGEQVLAVIEGIVLYLFLSQRYSRREMEKCGIRPSARRDCRIDVNIRFAPACGRQG